MAGKRGKRPAGDGSVTRRGERSWRIRASGGFGTDGKRRRVERTVRGTEADARQALRALVREVETGTDLDSGRITVSELLERVARHKAARNDIRPRQLRRYLQLTEQHIGPVMGSLRLSKVRPTHVEAVLDAMRAKGLAPKTLGHARQWMGTAFRQAIRWQLMATNPVEAVKAPKVDRGDLEVPDPQTLGALVDAARGADMEPAVVLLVATGLRRAEALGLRWRDVDLDARRIQVRQTLQRVPHERDDGTWFTRLEFTEPKTDRAKRSISLPAFAVEVLRSHRIAQNARRLELGSAWEDHDLIFGSWNGAPRDPDAFGHGIRRLMVDAGLDPKTRLHDLRHGFATALLERGVHPAIASAVLGHSSPAFTMSVYQHVLDGMTDTAADAISVALGRGSAPTAESEGERWPR